MVDVPIKLLPKPKLQCEVCQSADPDIIVLVRYPSGFARTRACSRECTEKVHLRYAHNVLKAQLEASVPLREDFP